MMNWLGFLNGALTLLAITIFLGIVYWAFSKKRATEFDQAAQAPFALSDDDSGSSPRELKN